MASTAREVYYSVDHSLYKLRQKRVAVYVRVSRETETKHVSVEAQKQFLLEEIGARANWEFVGFYVDEGVTGTKMHRPAFDKMLRDARAGKIDIILTKSISRFGRNNSEMQKVLQELKSMDVTVIFDSDKLSTANPMAMMSIQLMGIQAENEARQTSENQKWSIRKRWEKGIPTYSRPYGYEMRDHEYKVIPEEAEVIRRIFDMYLSGKGVATIAKTLNHEGIPSRMGVKWSRNSISYILRNEKYAGNLILQKWYKKDFISKLGKMNYGELPMYLVENAHEPIITIDTYEKTQEEIKRRAGRRAQAPEQTTRLFSQLLICGGCGNTMYYKVNKGNGTFRELWMCKKHMELGKEVCPTRSIREDILIQTTKEVLMEQGIIPKPRRRKNYSKVKQKEITLTNEFLKDHILRIVVREDQKLEYQLFNGEIVIKPWQYESRSKSWTPEMRQKARERTIQQNRRRKEETKKEGVNAEEGETK